MAGTREIKAGRAYVELFLKDNKYVRGLARAQQRLRAFGAQLTSIGQSMLRIGGMMAIPFVIGAKLFANFEQQMQAVATMLDKPEEHMERFRSAIKAMSVEMGEATETLAKGLYDILSASIAPEQALYVLGVASKAAVAGITDTGIAADAITTILNSYGLAADQAGDVSDWLFSIVKRGKTTFAELAPAIGLTSSLAASAGVSLNELGAVLATMTRSGVKTENAITAVTGIISSFLKPTDDAAKYARELGFEMSTATLKSEGLAGVFEKIAALPPDALAKLFPNVRALRGVLPAIQNMAGFSEDMQVMAQRAGATDAAYDKLSGTLLMKFKQAKEGVIQVLSAIAEALVGNLKESGEWFTKTTKHITEYIEKHQDLIVTIAELTAKTIVVAAVLFVLGKVLMGVAGAIIIVKGAILALNAALWLITLHPIVAVMAALAAAIGVVGYKFYQTRKAALAFEKTMKDIEKLQKGAGKTIKKGAAEAKAVYTHAEADAIFAAAKAKVGGMPESYLKEPTGTPEHYRRQIDKMRAASAAAAGTFSAAAVRRLGAAGRGETTLQRIAGATEESEEHLAIIRREKPVWGT